MVTIIVRCSHCGSDNLKRNGHASNGKQRYYCRDCKKQSRENPTPHAYTEEKREEILRSYEERSSLRGLTRTFGVSRNTVSGLLKKSTKNCPIWVKRCYILMQEMRIIILEADELWSFVGSKENKVWVWIVLCRKTRQVVSYAIGDRSEVTCQKLWNSVPEAFRDGHCYTDLWSAYQVVIPRKQHTAVGKEIGETAHVERWNNTLRQRLGRFVWKTLVFQIYCHALHLSEPLSPSLQFGKG